MVLFRQHSEASGAVPRLLRVSPLRHSFRVTTSTMDDPAYSSDADSTISVPDFGSQDLDRDKKEFLTSKKPPSHYGPITLIIKIAQEIRNMDDLTVLSLFLFGFVLLTTVLLGTFSQRRYFMRLEAIMAAVEKTQLVLLTKSVLQIFICYVLELTRRHDDNVNMSLYMSEMRRKSRIQRPQRPAEIEDRSPEFLPNLRAERVVKDGVAVLDISEDGDDFSLGPQGEDAEPRDTPRPRRRLRAF